MDNMSSLGNMRVRVGLCSERQDVPIPVSVVFPILQQVRMSILDFSQSCSCSGLVQLLFWSLNK